MKAREAAATANAIVAERERRKRLMAEVMADEVLRIAKREIKPGGALFAATIGVMLDPVLMREAGAAAKERLRAEHGLE